MIMKENNLFSLKEKNYFWKGQSAIDTPRPWVLVIKICV